MNIKHIVSPLRVKALGQAGTFTGYASVFGNRDLQNEVVAKGAFSRSLQKWRMKNSAPAMLWMHDPAQPIGCWIALIEDTQGLKVEGRLALRTQKGAEANELLTMGALTGLSIGYRVVTSKIDAQQKARVLTALDLFEISLVTFPANEAARIGNVPVPASLPKLSDAAILHASARRLRQAARRLASV